MVETFQKIYKRGKKYVATNILFLTFIITSVINGMIVHGVTVDTAFYIKPLIANLVVVILIGSFAYFMKPKHRYIYFFIVSIILTAICMINAIYYKNYLSFASISLLTTLSELGGYTDAVFENILQWKDFIYLWQLFAITFVHLQLNKKGYYEKVQKEEQPKIRFLNTIVVTLILLGLFISMLTSTDISRLEKQWNREYVVMEFGIYVYQFNDVVTCARTKLNSMFGYDEAAKAFREYYAEVPEESPNKNKYTNLFKGKNVLVIHAESIQNFLISDDFRDGKPASFNGIEVTPNLNRLASEGIYFSNFYSQESAGTSSDTEFTFNTSLLPSSSGTVFMNYFDREYVTLPKMFKEQGYYTFSMHANKGSAWNRTVVHPNLGYDKFYYYTDAYTIDEEIGLGLSDKSFFRQSVDHIKEIDAEHENWYGLLIMLTNHTPFSDIERYSEETGWTYEVDYKYTEIDEETGEEVEASYDYLEGTKLGNYIKSARYADESIGELLEKMDAEGLLEDTVVIIYGDHDAKLRSSEFNRYYNYDFETGEIKDKDDESYIQLDDYTYEINRSVPFIIWSKDIANNKKYATEITTVTGMIDAQPTIANMFGMYNKYALGHDMMSTDENVVVFPSGNWMTNKMYYNSAKEAYKLLDIEAEIPVDYITTYSLYADEINTISNSIITFDLIKKVGENPDNELLEEIGDSEL